MARDAFKALPYMYPQLKLVVDRTHNDPNKCTVLTTYYTTEGKVILILRIFQSSKHITVIDLDMLFTLLLSIIYTISLSNDYVNRSNLVIILLGSHLAFQFT